MQRRAAVHHQHVVAGLRRVLVVGTTLLLVTTAAAAAPPDRVMRVDAPADPDVLDPALNYTDLGWSILWATCTPLMRIRTDGSGVVPGGTEAWPVVSPDGRIYNFRIRRNLRFSDGTRVTAASYARGLGRVVAPVSQSPLAGILGDVSTVAARGSTLSVRLKRPAADFVTRMGLPLACPVPAGLPADPAGIDLRVSSGPYSVVSHSSDGVVLRPNPNASGASFSEIDLRIGATVPDAYRDVAAGSADLAWESIGDDPPTARAAVARFGIGRGRLLYPPSPASFYLAFNMQRPLFKGNAALRRAINFALDRQAIVRELSYGLPYGYRRTDQLIPSGVIGYRDSHLYPLGAPDLKEARRLAKGRLHDGRLTLYTFAGDAWQRAAGVIAYDLKQIGLTVDIQSFTSPVLRHLASTPNASYDMVGPMEWIVDYPDPADVLNPLLSRGPTNFSHLDDPKLQHALAVAAGIRGPARYGAYVRLERRLLSTDPPVAPVASGAGLYFVGARVGCVRFRMGAPLVGSFCPRGSS